MPEIRAVRPSGGRLLPYDPALDGLRAVAVLAVMLYHGRVGWAPGGYLGVDLFFVLSGYLITTLLVLERRSTDRIDLGAFWFRRARRLFPALFLILVWVVLYGALVADSDQADAIRGDVVATTFYVANWEAIFSGSSYFEQFAGPSPLQHTWSLAIEEQWYLVWPIVLAVGLSRTRSKRWWTGAALAATGLSAAWMVALHEPGTDPSRVYYGTDTRVQGLLLGAALAFALQGRVDRWRAGAGGRVAGVAAWAGLAGFVAFVAVAGDQADWMYRGGLTLVAVSAALLIGGVTVAAQGSALRTILSAPPLRATGVISYGLYLWHWPVYVLLTSDRVGFDGTPLLAVRVAVTFAVAWASYVLVERPVRRADLVGRRLAGTSMAAAGLVVALVLLAIPPAPAPLAGAIRIDADGTVSAQVEPEPGELVSGDAAAAIDVEAASSVALAVPELDAETPDAETPDEREPVIEPVPDGPLSSFLVGDSVHLSLAMGFEHQRYLGDVRLTADVRLGCGVIVDTGNPNCIGQLQSWFATIRDEDPSIALVGIAKWDVSDLAVDDEILELGTEAYDRAVMVELDRDVALLSAGGARMIVIGLPCMRPTEEIANPFAPLRTDPARVAHLNQLVQTWADGRPNVAFVDLAAFTCPTGEFQAELDGVELFVDGVHFTPDGARLVWSWLVPEIERLARGDQA